MYPQTKKLFLIGTTAGSDARAASYERWVLVDYDFTTGKTHVPLFGLQIGKAGVDGLMQAFDAIRQALELPPGTPCVMTTGWIHETRPAAGITYQGVTYPPDTVQPFSACTS